MELRFEPIHVALLDLQEVLEQLAGSVVGLFRGHPDGAIVHGHGVDFELQIALNLGLHVWSHGKLHRFRHAGGGVQEENPLDQRLGVLHFLDGRLLGMLAEPVVVPVVAHLGMEKVLVHGGQFFFERLIQ